MMRITAKTKRIFSALTGIALLCAGSISTASAKKNIRADISVNGQVTVNGQQAVSSATVVSGSTITTGTASRAVIGLGGNGLVELLPETSLTLKYTDNSIMAMLASGKVLITNSAGIGTTVTTRSATVVADAGRTNTFSVDIGCGDDVKCAQTMVQTVTGLVTMKTGETTKTVTAGTGVFGGGPQGDCKPCFRAGSSPRVPIAAIGSGGLGGILVTLGGAVGTAIIVGKKDDGPDGGGGVDVSPIQ